LAEDLTTLTTEDVGAELTIGQPPVVLQMQSHAFIPLERPEQLRQWEEDLRNFYGISLDASAIVGRACETCSCCSTDDCGILQQR
jgi:hypothetical protein